MLSAKLNDIKGAELSKLIKVILSVYFEGGILLLSTISHITAIRAQVYNIQLMHSFEVDIRICPPENSDVH